MEIKSGFYSASHRKSVLLRCIRLDRICFDVSPEDQEGYAKLLCLHRNHQRFARISGIPKRLCEDVVEICPEMVCEYVHNPYRYHEPGFCDLSTLDELAPLITDRGLNIVNSQKENDLADATEDCEELETIHLSVSNPHQAITATKELFRFDKRLLESFHLSILWDGRGGNGFEQMQGDSDDILPEIGCHGAQLRKCKFTGALSDIGAFQRLACSAPLLEEVRISFLINYEAAPIAEIEGRIREAVETFLKCANLRFLEITSEI